MSDRGRIDGSPITVPSAVLGESPGTRLTVGSVIWESHGTLSRPVVQVSWTCLTGTNSENSFLLIHLQYEVHDVVEYATNPFRKPCELRKTI